MELKFILESLLFSAQKPLSPAELRDILAAAAEQVDAVVEGLGETRPSPVGSEAACRDAGRLRIEGKEYIVKDGDVMHFRFNV